MFTGIFMRFLGALCGMLLSALVFADQPAVEVPPEQDLMAVEYPGSGRCGVRAIGVTKDQLWINVLLTAFEPNGRAPFGIFKVVARRIDMENGVPEVEGGKIKRSSIGRIYDAWIKTETGEQLLFYKGQESPHNDGYMSPVDFNSALTMMNAIPRMNFRVGFSRAQGGPDEVYEFNRRMTEEDAGKLSTCLKGLLERKMGPKS
jgi:hypothetical protein